MVNKIHSGNTKIVVIGGGAGGLELIARLCKLAKRMSLEIILIDKQLKHVWKPLLHEVASGTFTSYQDEIDYISYAFQKGFQFVLGAVKEINQQHKFVTVDSYSNPLIAADLVCQINYDILILATGSRVNDFNIPGVLEHSLLLDDLSKAESFHQKLIEHIISKTQNNSEIPIKISIVGGGATGVELASELSYALSQTFKYLKNTRTSPFQITLIESSNRVLNVMPERISMAVSQYLIKNNIELLTNTRIVKVTREGLETDNQQFIDASIIVWAAGVKASRLAFTQEIALNEANQFVVNDKLQLVNDSAIFALGDCASCAQKNKWGEISFVPPRAQAAHQQAKILVKSINNSLNNKPLLAYVYKDYGSLISLSHSYAVGNLMNRTAKNFYIEGKIARLTYWLLYKKHLYILKGAKYVVLSIIMDMLMKQGPEIKLH